MQRDRYKPLPHTKLQGNTGTYRLDTLATARVGHDTPAIEVMTDLRRIQVVTIGTAATVNEANTTMIRHGIRLLLVVDDDGSVIGMLTATDILGEKPVRVASSRGLRFDELSVGDIMVPAEQVDVIELREVLSAKVGHVVAALKGWGRQHALVTDEDESGRRMIRGIFSLTQIGRLLGVSIQTSEVARNFAEIEAMIGH